MARVAKKKEEAVSLETVLWNCRVALRGVGSTDKNRDAVIGLCFLKFAGDKFEKRRAELITQYGDIPAFLEKASFYNAVNVFYLKETARWAYIVKNAGANDIAVILDQAMADIEENNPSLKGALSLNLYATLGAPKEKSNSLSMRSIKSMRPVSMKKTSSVVYMNTSCRYMPPPEPRKMVNFIPRRVLFS